MSSDIYENLYNKINDLINEYNVLKNIFDNGNKTTENIIISGNPIDNGVLLKCKNNCDNAISLLVPLSNICKNEIKNDIEVGDNNEK